MIRTGNPIRIPFICLLGAFLWFSACGDDSGNNATDKDSKEEQLQDESDDAESSDSKTKKKSSSSVADKKSNSSESKDSGDKDSKGSSGSSKTKSSDSKSSGNEKDSINSSSSAKDSPKSSSGKSSSQPKNTVTDSRDGKIYKTVKIGSQVWFAENLNYDDGNSVCPMNEEAYCEKYGRLYSHEKAGGDRLSIQQGACPEGFHIPDLSEWNQLIKYVSKHNDGEGVATSLKAKEGWVAEGDSIINENPTRIRIGAAQGTDRFGFGALPAGSCWDNGCYTDDDVRFIARDWQTLTYGILLALDDNDITIEEYGQWPYTSIRCLKNSQVKIDSMPAIDIIDSNLWTTKNLTSKGSESFKWYQAIGACPDGWRLPTKDELKNAFLKKDKIDLEEQTHHRYWITDGQNNTGCIELAFHTINGARFSHFFEPCYAESDLASVLCISEDKASLYPITYCECKASEFNPSDSTATWTVSECEENDFKINQYEWDFGEESDGVKTKGATATKKFFKNRHAAPLVTIKGDATVKDMKITNAMSLQCPDVLGTPLEGLIFKSREKITILAGKVHQATIDKSTSSTGCGQYTVPALNCSITNAEGEMASLKIAGKEFNVLWAIYDEIEGLCDLESFSVETSIDMECSIDF